MQVKLWDSKQNQFTIMEIEGIDFLRHAYKEILLYAYAMTKLGCSRSGIRRKFCVNIEQADRFWRDCDKLVTAIENGDDAEKVVF